MAESGLSIGFTELKQAVGRLLGYGTTVVNWSAAQVAEIEGYVQNGVRRVYYPPAFVPEMAGYEWSFLKDTTTLALVADDYDYDLPDDFGRLVGPFHYAEDEYRPSIEQISVSDLLAKRAMYGEEGNPYFCATRYKTEDRTTGSRQEVLFYPTPDEVKTLSYTYEAYSGPLSDSYPYPLGGMQLAELFTESCLAAVEAYRKDGVGVHTEMFKALLIDAVARDRKRGPRQFGQMGARTEATQEFRRGYTGGTYPITYKSESI